MKKPTLPRDVARACRHMRRLPAWGECPCSGEGTELAAKVDPKTRLTLPADTPQVSAPARNHPRPEPPRESPLVDPSLGVYPGTDLSMTARRMQRGTAGSERAIIGHAFEFWNPYPTRRILRGVDPTARQLARGRIWSQSRGKPRLPPLRLAFFSRLSYWCDIRCAWIWAMKSITTTTTINSDVPPK